MGERTKVIIGWIIAAPLWLILISVWWVHYFG